MSGEKAHIADPIASPKGLSLETWFLLVLALLPLMPGLHSFIKPTTFLLVYSILALGLHVTVGYAGMLHLGVAAFFGIGAYVAGILASTIYPFQWGFTVSFCAALLISAVSGMILAAPTLRLRGDYLALVTLGFGEVLKIALRNLANITNGTQAISPIPPPLSEGWPGLDRKFFYITLATLAAIVFVLKRLECSRLGRAWIALREDELAASCMGIDPARVRMSAFAVGSAIAGGAGALYAFLNAGTAQPDTYDFNRSIITLCCLILGGLGGIRGAIAGVFLLLGFDQLISPMIDSWIQNANINPHGYAVLKFSSWRLMVFGFALILTMRFRPEGLFPAPRVKLEFHEYDEPAAKGAA